MTSITAGRWLERGYTGSIFLLAVAAPVSIAGTQAAWGLALLFWLLRLVFQRPSAKIRPIDVAVIAFLGLTIVSSAFSYEPAVSMRKLASVSLVSIVYLVFGAVKCETTVRRIVVLMLISGVASTIWTFGVLARGKNIKIDKLAASSPLAKSGAQENDTILKLNGNLIDSPGDVDAVLQQAGGRDVSVQLYRHEFLINGTISAAEIAERGDGLARLGVEEWSRGRDTRATGFYGHYITYAEALQLLLSLAAGLLIALPGPWLAWRRVLLGLTCLSYLAALFLTVTRSSWAAFAVSAALMVVLGASRRTLLICVVAAVPVVLAGLWYLNETRKVGFVDTSDDSTAWRLEVWREGVNVLVSSPRHLAVGIGLDSLKTHWQDWGMFENGRRPLGHMHSTPLQLAFERGVPTLIAWIVWMLLYLRMLWRGIRERRSWLEHGLLLGAFGGTIGFLVSGLVQYNWGDSEDVMILYIIMGLAFGVLRRPMEDCPLAAVV